MSRDAIRALARHGRTFRLAGTLLSRADLDAAAELYVVCRAVDDLADEAPDPAAARAALLALRAEVGQGRRASPLAARFAALGACPRATAAFLDTILGDLDPVRIADEAALVRYAYGAAGTVGVLMCGVLGVRDPAAEPHAVDLGIAMQLTNIARDVVEDAARDRLYLPATWLPPGFAPGDVARDHGSAFLAVRRLLALADQRYRSAARGYRHLPPRARLAIRVAGRLYEEIGLRILRAGPGYLNGGRCIVPMPRKLALLTAEAASMLARRPPARHEAALPARRAGLTLPGRRAGLQGAKGREAAAGKAGLCPDPPHA